MGIRKCIWRTRTRKRTIKLSVNELINEMINDEYDTIIEECTKQKSKPLFRVTPTKKELKVLFILLIVPAFLSIFKKCLINGFNAAFDIGEYRVGNIYRHRNKLYRYEKISKD
ncbi:MAG: hypothetical protein AB8G11_04030 [Saprospiraceae bacterium]